MSRSIKQSDSTTLVPNLGKGQEISWLEAESREDSVLRARKKFERWVQSFYGLLRHQFMPLVTPPGASDEGIFEADEFSLVPTRDLQDYRLSFDEAREMLDHMEEQLEAALAAREAEEE